MSDQLITLKSFHDLVLATVCKAYLEENGIQCSLIKTDLLPGLITPELAPLGHVNLEVLEPDVVPALAMLQLAGLIPRIGEETEGNSALRVPRASDLIFECEFCSENITIAVSDDSSIVHCPNCLEYVDVPESS